MYVIDMPVCIRLHYSYTREKLPVQLYFTVLSKLCSPNTTGLPRMVAEPDANLLYHVYLKLYQ